MTVVIKIVVSIAALVGGWLLGMWITREEKP